MHRRTLLTAPAAAGALSLPFLRPAAAQTPLRFCLDWALQGNHAMWALAEDRGYFRREGLAVRMDRHCDNAERVVDLLLGHPRVSRVYYPGLPGHPGHDVAARQMRRFGGMVSLRVRDGQEEALKVCRRTRVFTLGESLGGVESLIEHPGLMTHASVAGSALQVPDDLIRLSVGIEDADDLLADLRDALD